MEKDTAIGDYNRDSRVKVLCSWLVDLAGHRLVCDTEEILNALFDKERDILGRAVRRGASLCNCSGEFHLN